MPVYAFKPLKSPLFRGFPGMVGGQAGQIIQSPPERASKCVGKMFPPLVFLPVLCYADISIKKDRSGQDGRTGNVAGQRHDQGRRRG